MLGLVTLLLTATGLSAGSAADRVIDPYGRYCFRIDAGWKDEGYDANSDSIAIRHGATRLRLTHNESCWLMEHRSPEESREIEASLFGFGRRRSLDSLEGRYGDGCLALYATADGDPADRPASPFFGCADLDSGWLILQGTVSSTDEESIRRIIREVRADCARFDPENLRP